MKGTVFSISLVAFAIVAQSRLAADEPTPTTQRPSSQVPVVKDFHAFLGEVTAGNARPMWAPAGDQPSRPRGDDHGENRPFISAATVVRQLRAYPDSLPGLTVADCRVVAGNVSLLQDFRDLLMHTPSYADLVIVDTINRVIFVCLSRSIILAKKVSPEVASQVQRLHGFSLQPSVLTYALGAEPASRAGTAPSRPDALAVPAVAPSASADQMTKRRASQKELDEFCRLLMNASGTTDLNDALAKARPGSAMQLVEKRDFPALLMLMWGTESYIHVALPWLALYVEKCPDFSLSDGFPKVKTVLGLREADRQRYGSYLAATTPGTEDAVREVLAAANTGTLDAYAGLTEAQQRLQSKPSNRPRIEKALLDIEGAKAQIAMLRSLSPGDSVTFASIRTFLRKDVFMPEQGGEYQVGTVGRPAKFVFPDGTVISVPK